MLKAWKLAREKQLGDMISSIAESTDKIEVINRPVETITAAEGVWPEFPPVPFWGIRVAIALVGFAALAHGLPTIHLAALV